MPTKTLYTQADRSGLQQEKYRFGGGDDIVFAFDDGVSDFGYWIDGFKGSDTIYGSDSAFSDTLIGGDGSDSIYGGGGDDTIYGGFEDGTVEESKGPSDPPANFLVGDGWRDPVTDELSASISVGANNAVTGGNDTIYGGHAVGGSNEIYADYQIANLGVGAAFHGGHDTVVGGNGSTNTVHGDADTVTLSSNAMFAGGTDTLTGGNGTAAASAHNLLYGDAESVFFTAGGGADGETFSGGDDLLRGGNDADNTLVGDVVSVNYDGLFFGGNDRLIAGTGAGVDDLIGDWANSSFADNAVGGADVFEIHIGTGTDWIWDFEPLNVDANNNQIGDIVELHGFGITDFDDLQFVDDIVNHRTTLDLGGGDQIVFLDHLAEDFTADDFLFVG